MEIQILNPSSRTDTGITKAIGQSLAWCRGPLMPAFRCLTLADGPRGISTAADSDRASPVVARHIAEDETASAYVVACFSDPGVFAARQLTDKPVIGIGEAGFAAAMMLGDQIGTISVSKGGAKKVKRQVRHLGLTMRHGGHRDLGLDYGDLQHHDLVNETLIRRVQEMVDEGVDVVLFAGAGLAQYAGNLQMKTSLPVVDPTQAAALVALTQAMAQSKC
ncbi:aspartate/glutamate racemase family protein [Roseovarius sp. 2305UL8-3]|uniref:aspartate/glutamate racemase family protein n=1 Tax=Roseovarius conchicola TaxID=3121636 RepID=UPI0035280E59